MSSRAENLEAIEMRLKQDVIREAARFGGLVMCHEEVGTSDELRLKPTWISVDADTVKTVKEVFGDLRSQGWRCDYHRVPISQDQPIENNYLDAYTRILRELDPTRTCVVANCGAGVTRTTFAMVAAQIIRRRQLMLMGRPDPFQLTEAAGGNTGNAPGATPSPTAASPVLESAPLAGSSTKRNRSRGRTAKMDNSMAKSLRATYEKQAQAQALLRLVQLLGKAGSDSPVDLLLGSPSLLDSLRRALVGDFNVIRALCGILDEGLDDKVVVDVAIDSSAHLTNLREAILLERASYALTGTDQPSSTAAPGSRAKNASDHLTKAVRSLEKYFFLCAFSSYVSGSQEAVFQHSFADWLKTRSEIWNTIKRIRSKGKQLYLFDPVADLSQLSPAAASQHVPRLALAPSSEQLLCAERTGAGDEFAEHHVRNLRSGIVLRPGTLLKEDIWQAQREHRADSENFEVRGTINFRRIPGTSIFATGQPTVDGIRNVLRSVSDQAAQSHESGNRRPISCTWLNLREEPLLYIAGKPYVLRDSTLSLRNTKAYDGISWARLQLLEDRLKTDVINELEENDGRLLLHSEDANGEVFPQWQEVEAEDVKTLQDVMAHVASEFKEGLAVSLGSSEQPTAGDLVFRRLPFTAERPPDLEDMGALLQTILRAQGSSIINNDQLGRGRSSLCSVIVLLISQWLHKHSPSDASMVRSVSETSMLAYDASIGEDVQDSGFVKPQRAHLSYHLINSLLRVVPHGLQVKQAVDSAIDRVGSVMNLRDAIEDARLAADEIEDRESPLRKQKIQTGCQALRRYFYLIVFQAYLQAVKPDTIHAMQTFDNFVRKQPVLETIGKEFDKEDISLITPLQRIEAADGMALDDEVTEVVANRDGAILTAYTMLKSDFFSGIAKVHLSQIEGIPNLRCVALLIDPSGHQSSASSQASSASGKIEPVTWGSGQATIEGLRRGLTKMGASPEGSTRIVWTSLREEPVIYVRGRPHVLRLADQPLTNLEATGITTETVERQEIALKNDVIREARRSSGRILLHDEVEIEPGKFDIIPVWESIKEEDVLTPRDVYELVQSEGYKVDYSRVAVTDEQAPMPAVFSQLERRVLFALSKGASTAFSCQMGRGRTSVSLCIASLVSTIHLYRDEILNDTMMASSILTSNSTDEEDGKSTTTSQRMTNAKDFLDNREDELFLQGEYRTILQLVGVLSHGKLAKRLVDAAIDRMEAVQNLRKAIYDSRLRAENADFKSKKRLHLATVYVNYLKRYGYMIAFANYLVEKAKASLDGDDDETDQEEEGDGATTNGDKAAAAGAGGTSSKVSWATDGFPSFLEWLNPRREVDSIIRNSTGDQIAL